MANYGGGMGGGRTGPYWRRQMGMTLPGEQTGAELSMMNAQRGRVGLAPLGGGMGLPATQGMAPPRPQAPADMRGVTGAPPGAGLPPELAMMLARLLQKGRPPAPPQRSVLPGLVQHRAVSVRPHVRMLAPKHIAY